jgi:hypothetical protein
VISGDSSIFSSRVFFLKKIKYPKNGEKTVSPIIFLKKTFWEKGFFLFFLGPEGKEEKNEPFGEKLKK